MPTVVIKQGYRLCSGKHALQTGWHDFTCKCAAGATFASLALGRFVFLPFQRDNVKKQVWAHSRRRQRWLRMSHAAAEELLCGLERRAFRNRTVRRILEQETGLQRCAIPSTSTARDGIVLLALGQKREYVC